MTLSILPSLRPYLQMLLLILSWSYSRLYNHGFIYLQVFFLPLVPSLSLISEPVSKCPVFQSKENAALASDIGVLFLIPSWP